MFGRKAKEQPKSTLQRERMRPSQQAFNPAFSYYTSRQDNNNVRRTVSGQAESSQPQKRPSMPFWYRFPLLLLVVVGSVCFVKLVLLGTDPKVITLGKNATSATYMQTSTVYEIAAQKLLASSITNRTKITANLDGTANTLKQQFPELQAVSITLPLIGNRPIIYVQAAQPSVVLQGPHGNFALNKSGLVLAQLHELPQGVPVAVDQSGATLKPGKIYLPSSTVSFIQTVQYQFKAANLPISTFVLPSGNPYELDARVEGKPYVVRFNLIGDSLTQSGGAIATIQQLGTTVPAEYIDIRTPDRVYYK